VLQQAVHRPSEGPRLPAARQTRRVAIDAYADGLLTACREQCEADCATIGIELARDAFVFSTGPDCAIALLLRTVTQKYRRLATRLGPRSSRLHSMCHYVSTVAIDMCPAYRAAVREHLRTVRYEISARLHAFYSGAPTPSPHCTDSPAPSRPGGPGSRRSCTPESPTPQAKASTG
jgi:hypothetical protein